MGGKGSEEKESKGEAKQEEEPEGGCSTAVHRTPRQVQHEREKGKREGSL